MLHGDMLIGISMNKGYCHALEIVDGENEEDANLW